MFTIDASRAQYPGNYAMFLLFKFRPLSGAISEVVVCNVHVCASERFVKWRYVYLIQVLFLVFAACIGT